VHGLRAAFFSQETRQLETNNRAHAVTEKSKWLIQIRSQILRNVRDQIGHLRKKRFPDATPSSW
jgi:hypothetical protein